MSKPSDFFGIGKLTITADMAINMRYDLSDTESIRIQVEGLLQDNPNLLFENLKVNFEYQED